MSELIRIGEWEADPARCVVRRGDGAPVKLSPRAMTVLVHLTEHAGEVLSTESLVAAHWPHTVTSPNAVHKVVSELRHVLGDVVETIPKRGYRLIPAVERTANGSALPLQPAAAPSPALHSPDSANGIALRAVIPARRHRAVAVVSILGLLLIAVTWLAFGTERTQVSFITSKNRSAALLPIRHSENQVERQVLETARDKTVARLAVLGGTNVRSKSVPRWLVATATAVSGVDYTLALDVVESQARLHATLAITPESNALPTHREQLDGSSAHLIALSDVLAAHAAEDLAVLLDDERVGRMRRSGTLNVDAYRLAREAATFHSIPSPGSLKRAAGLYRQAIQEDRKFKSAYLNLSAVYETLFVTPRDTADREHIRQSIQELAREARVASVDTDTQGVLDRLYREMSAGSVYDAEEQWRTEIIRNPRSFEGLNRYSRLLAGAKLFAEARQYLEMCIQIAREAGQPGWVAGSEENYASYAEGQGNFEEAIRLMKRNVERHPDETASLFGLVRTNAKVGRYAQAEAYLARLERVNEMWAYGASIWLGTLRGHITPGSVAMQEAFADPQMTNASRGAVCFMLGDVECGVRWWRQMEPGYVPIYWEFGPGNEIYWAPSVLTDPRYRAVVDDLGWGPRWRAYFRKKAAELTPITGVEVTSPLPPEDLVAQESTTTS